MNLVARMMGMNREREDVERERQELKRATVAAKKTVEAMVATAFEDAAHAMRRRKDDPPDDATADH